MTDAPLNIKITIEADRICGDLVESGLFSTKQDAYVYAMNLALGLDLEVDTSLNPTENKWDTAAVFQKSNRDLYALFKLLGHDEQEIVKKAMGLAEAGLRHIQKKQIQNLDLVDVLLISNKVDS